ncbi:MAG: DUF4870 domain-containing protein [Chloroflexi bacterium]|nr:DUF4870 domain-containing protein [Chloroflexota bacterium]
MENPTSEEKVLAALAHGSVLFAWFGPIAPTILWITQRKKSKYVRFHALQAMGYQALGFWGWILGVIAAFIGMFGVTFLAALVLDANQMKSSAIEIFLQFFMILSIFGLWGFFFLGGLAGAVFCMTGHDFRYPIIGPWLKNKLFADQVTDEDFERWEDAWVGGICHLTVVVQLFGIITPLIVWFTQKERSVKLRLQALQAAFYQLISVIAYVLTSVGSLVFFFVLMASVVIVVGGRDGSNESVYNTAGGVLLLLILGMFLVELLAFLLVPLYYLLAGIGALRTMRGHEFKYPILGGILARRMPAIPPQEAAPSAQPGDLIQIP